MISSRVREGSAAVNECAISHEQLLNKDWNFHLLRDTLKTFGEYSIGSYFIDRNNNKIFNNMSITNITISSQKSYRREINYRPIMFAVQKGYKYFFVIRNLAKGLFLNVPYFWTSFDHIIKLKVP